ncbi:conserved Plasmodium protein, unknown function [Plasmodium berghei]|uniref:Uncharacterized protein n=2 Tax=Plasmodium berghei TaxID=5821 RepID=A0A509AK11_PLABA|nr:conserved Plasmodium protein, unknown function [Plasmodium berghei ANKA]SCM22050.1 conserved Plasmodium protein, unknown function [Plasmodium berghei]SCN25247.1 conserved Plasmodium protein, unknown function [Plasmodium berghei]SCO60234.1 conserved Plasmodium protein, unknown function [Plasmodium berghei]SCO61876.1 conserved Plasmodium protein, unknown function [Plasmodium berghei]VUC55710.1 conserved Plasmodium protein, unknown function [Plasmodium berghei ANKA]|eukprot:XP_034421520.1 conserved Plasmodium protein, unknown function [Plasmodium berghei ANKA]
MKYLIVGKEAVGKNIQTKKREFLYFFRINRFSSTEFIKNDSIFDLIAKKKKNNNIEWDNKFIKNGEENIFCKNEKRKNIECDINNIGKAKQERDSIIKKGINSLEHSDNDIYNNKLYILRYAKHLNENDDIYKYRFITKYVIKNITRYYDNEILFILKIFAKKKYKNLIFLQCTSEYFYWLCKLNKGNKKNISYYLYYCSILNYIPTLKYVEEYIKIFDCFIYFMNLNNQTKQIKSNNSHIYLNSYIKHISSTTTQSLYGKFIEEETDYYHKDVKYIIYLVYFLNKANIKNEVYNRLLDMCCYYAGHLTLNKSFLLLNVVIVNIENNIYNFSNLIKNIHKNIERHINAMDQSYFIKYINILLYNNIKIENSFFLFIKKYIEKHQTDLSEKSILAILKIKKKKNFKDTTILKNILTIVIKSFYQYTYDNILYILKVLTFFKYFDKAFFKFIFDKYIQINYLSHYQRQNVYTNISQNQSSTYISSEKSYSQINDKINLIFDHKSENNFFKSNGPNQNINSPNIEYDQLRHIYTNFQELKQNEKTKNKKINNLSHLPLHLDIQETKLKINPLNIVNNEIVSYNKMKNPILFNLEYIDMYITLFIYMGVSYYRDVIKLNELSRRIKFYLIYTQIPKYNSLLKKNDIPVLKKKKNQYIGFFQIIDKIKEHENSNLKFVDKTKGSISFPIIHNEKNTKQRCQFSKTVNKYLKHYNDYENCNKLIKEKTKRCLHFSYSETEKNRLENLKKKKKINNEITNKPIYNTKYMNVQCFKESKINTKNKMNHNLDLKNELYNKKKKKKYVWNDFIFKFFHGFHPAFIRLYNRKIFNKYFNDLYKSEKYTDKSVCNDLVKTSRQKKITNKHKINMKKYKKIKILKGVCMLKYKNIFKNKSNIISNYINKMYECKPEASQTYTGIIDMISKPNQIHIDDFMFNNNENNISLFKRKIINKYNSLIYNSVKNMRKEYLENKTGNNITYDSEYINGNKNYIIKWIYRFINNSNIFNKNKQIEIKYRDIQKVATYLSEHYTENFLYSNTSINEKIKISLKNISLFSSSFTNLYFYDKDFIDIIINEVLYLIGIFCNLQKQKCQIKKSERINNDVNVIKEENYYVSHFVDIYKFLIICLQINNFINNILEADQRYQTLEKLIKIYTHNYYSYYLKCVVNMNRHIKNIIYINDKSKNFENSINNMNNYKYKDGSSDLVYFYTNYFDISIFANSFYLFNKLLFISIHNNDYKQVHKMYCEYLNNFAYKISETYLTHLYITSINNLKDVSLNNFSLLSYSYNNKLDVYFICINFYIIFISNQLWYFENHRKEGLGHDNILQTKKHTNCDKQKDEYNLDNHIISNSSTIFANKFNNLEYENKKEGNKKYLNFFERKNKHTTCKNLEIKNIIYIYKTLNIFFKYIKFVRNNNFITDINTCNKYFYHVIQFYYIFKTQFRKLKINYINEQNYHQIFPLFFIKILNKKNIKEISISQSFFFENDQKKGLPNQDNYFKNEFIYNYFHAFFSREKE